MLVQRPRRIPDPIAPAAAAASPLVRNTRSPKGWRKRESDGIGLAIVAALEKPCRDASPANLVFAGAPNLQLSAPIPISSPRVAMAAPRIERWDAEARCTSGTCHGGSMRWREAGNLWASPQGRSDEIPMADFLSRCYLCRKRLHGKDIYMYRGDKAFCSAECRYQQIITDDDDDHFHDKCGSHVSKQSDVAAAAAASSHGRLFFTAGIIAA